MTSPNNALNWNDDPLMTLLRNYYATNPSGGSLHVCLDDGNMEDGNVWFCLEWAAKERDLMGVQIACWLLALDEDTRYDLYDHYDDYAR
jgi:hypothetical protein